MSNKHFRRALAEKDAEILPGLKVASGSDEEVSIRLKKPAVNKFALLGMNEGESESTSEHEETTKKSTLSKKELSDSPSKSAKKKKNKKKKVKKDDPEDDDAILEAATKEALGSNPSSLDEITADRLLKVDPRNLSVENELKRLLGKNFGRSDTKKLEKTHRVIPGKLVKPKMNWPPMKHTGLYMVLDKEETREGYGELKWYRFRHNNDYQLLQQLFWMHLREMDHETILNNLLMENPYHLDSLLILAEVTRVQEDVQVSRDAIERGLFACEQSFHSTFQLLSQNYLLDYTWRENRAFFLLLLRHLQHMIQRRTFFTALQIAKVIFSKDPVNDPLAMLLVIDSLALKAREHAWLVEFYQCFRDKKNLELLPNFLFSTALAHYFLSKEQDSEFHVNYARDMLKMALIRFPFILGNILDRMSIQPDSKVDNNYYLSSTAMSRETDGLKLLADIYWKHTEELWRMPEVLGWLESTTHGILPEFEKAKNEVKAYAEMRKQRFVGMPQTVLRHSLVFDVRPSTDTDSLVDPAPPTNSKSDYEVVDIMENAHGTDQASSGTNESNTVMQFLRTLLPDDAQESVDALFAAYGGRPPLGEILGGVFARLGLAPRSGDGGEPIEQVEILDAGEAERERGEHEQALVGAGEEHDREQPSTSHDQSANSGSGPGTGNTSSDDPPIKEQGEEHKNE